MGERMKIFALWGKKKVDSTTVWISINPHYVISVEETGNVPPGCKIVMHDGREYNVLGTHLEVHDKLEQDSCIEVVS